MAKNARRMTASSIFDDQEVRKNRLLVCGNYLVTLSALSVLIFPSWSLKTFSIL